MQARKNKITQIITSIQNKQHIASPDHNILKRARERIDKKIQEISKETKRKKTEILNQEPPVTQQEQEQQNKNNQLKYKKTQNKKYPPRKKEKREK